MTYALSISRQYGSGGRAVGELVAQKLGCQFYDTQLVNLAAQKGRIPLKNAQRADEKALNPWLYTPLTSGAYIDVASRSDPEKMFRLQSDIIREAALADNCVFVGRCADAILEDEDDVELLSFYICAPLQWRVHRLVETEGYTKKEALSAIKKKDKQRAYYYNYYTGREYADPVNYDFCVDSSLLGVEKTAELLCRMTAFIRENR